MSNVVLTGQYTYQIKSDGTIDVHLGEIDNLSATATAPVRVELWVTSTPWKTEGGNQGYMLGALSLPGDGTLAAGQKLLDIDQNIAYKAPAAGTYYVTMVVAEHTKPDQGASAGYTTDSVKSFNHVLTFNKSGAVDITQLPTVSVTSQSVKEGDSGTQYMEFTLSLSDVSKLTTSVQFDTKDETARDGIDYKAVHQSVTFAPGATTAKVDVPIYGNTDFQPTRVFGVTLSGALYATASGATSKAVGYIDDDDGGSSFLPTDNFMQLEWQLYTTRVAFAWDKATGKGVKVAMLDTGVDASNADLTANVRTDLGRTALTLEAGGAPVTSTDNHGTLVAGVIAGARDGQGVVGVAYDAQLVSIYGAGKYGPNLLTEITNAYTYAKSFDVLNDSWGYGNLLKADTNWAFLDNANDAAFAPAFKALHDLAADGRHGLGTVVVQAAGNGYGYGDDTNLHNFQNSRYIITVGATDYKGDSSYFSTAGASILVAAPGGEGFGDYGSIITTDRSGAAGAVSGDYAFADGTSFSAPVVSGIVAMMLEVNPDLGYRDIQQILAYTAHQTDAAAGAVTANGATTWNGGGLQFIYGAQTTGFGQVDALAAVRLAATWNGTPQTVANTVELISKQAVNQAIPDKDVHGVTSSIDVAGDMTVERVDVSVDITHPFIGDLQIALTSPTGTTSFLLYRPSAGALSAVGSSQSDIHFTFDTVLDWGESAAGKWSLNVVDLNTGATGSFTGWTLDLIGQAAGKDHTYIYTNDYPALVAQDPSRAILSDSGGGNDTINLGALGADNYLDLSGATASSINDGKLTIAAGTTVRNGYGGDGNDTLIANKLGGALHGMDGNDILTGGAGRDVLDGGNGDDTLSGGAGTDTALYHGVRADYTVTSTGSGFKVQDTKGGDGLDLLSGVERLQFSDAVLAFDSGIDGVAGEAYRLYQAAFGRTPDKAGLGYWIGAMDDGMGLGEVARDFMQSAEYKTLYGADPSNAELLNHMYQNVLHRAPDSAGAAYWMDLLDHHRVDAATLLVDFSQSAENVAALVGATQNGIGYTPYTA